MIKGAKKGSQQAHKPHIAKDDLVSTETLNAMYGLCEGEIAGLADGGKSIRLDGTPIINDNGQPNFDGVTYEFRPGTNDQSYIKGFPSVENEIRVGVELRHDRQYVRAINNKELSAVRLRLNFNALRQQYDNGNITGYAIEYAVDVQTDGGAFVQVLTTAVRGKASSGFKRSHRIDLPKASRNWTIRVRRITPNRDSDLIADTMTVDAITEIIDAKLRYPNTAMLAVSYNAKTFSNVAKIAVRLKGKLIQVPSNYDPVARTYTGLWDGTFKLAYSDNPAWVFYDLCTHKRYGLGDRLSGMVDKWRLYQIAQYCDEMVDDGMGGREPRFAINVYIQKADDAYRVLQNIASVFRGLSFWDGLQIVLDSDTPKDPVYTFSAVNVVGEFNYQGTRQRDRHTVAKVAWDNPENDYATEYEMVRDEAAIAKYGIRMLDINAFGCTSKGQAQRAGLWALKSEQLETRTVSFKTGLMGFIPQVGQIINIADNVFAGRSVAGRIVSANARQITLDRIAGKVGDTLSINTDGAVKTAKITAIRGETVTLDKAIGNADDVWAIVADDLKLMQFRVLTIAQNDDATFDITALQYDRQKYDVVDNGASITQQPYTVLKATPIQAPASVTISQSIRTHQNQSVTTMTINWAQVQGAVAYQVRWRKDDGNWQNVPKMGGQSVDIDGVYSGNYIAEVQAIDAFDNESLATSSPLTNITGKVGKPPRPARLTATGKLFGMELAWSFNAGSGDTNYTEIQVSPDGVSNIATLGTFAYPTDKHTINGLQGNLTQFYRARIVDKLGNVSDWTDWVSGKTEAQADKVLNLLQGQITASQLHQDLSTPIGKIGTLETGLNTAKTDLSALNASMTTARADIDKAKTDLNTATSNINTERNRISAAIADITALQTANNAKTQELANLTQTVGTHTSSINSLAVTTGDLSQKYTQLKSASDNANAEITSIKQTQNGQATQLNTLNSRFDSLSVGGRNLLVDSEYKSYSRWGATANFSVTQALYNGRTLTRLDVNTDTQSGQMGIINAPGVRLTNIQGGVEYTLSLNVQATAQIRASGINYIHLMYSDGGVNFKLPTVAVTSSLSNRHSVKFIAPRSGNQCYLLIGIEGSFSTGEWFAFHSVKLERGNVATDWTPAPEDVDAQFTQTNANISTLQQTVTNADNALSQRIDALDASYKQADTTLNASITAEQTARTSADNALSQRITALDTAYKSADSALSSRIVSAEQSITTANQAIAQTQQTLTARFDSLSVGGRNYLTKASFGIWRDGTWRDYRFVISDKNTASPRFTRADAIEQGADVVFSFKIAKKSGRITSIGGHTHSLSHHQIYIDGVLVGNDFNAGVAYPDDLAVHHIVIKAKDHFATGTNDKALYIQPNRGSNGYADVYSCEIWDCKLERGTVATDWTPAPEDVDAQFTQTNANISTLQQTVTNADSALSQRITAIDTAYKSADSALSARVATAEQSITTANQAIATTQETLTAKFEHDNLFKTSTATNGKYYRESDGVMLGWGSHRASDYISVSTNTLYEIKAYNGDFSNLRVIWYDSDKNFIKGQIIARNGDYATFDSDNAVFVRISGGWTRQADNIWQMQKIGAVGAVQANLDEFKTAQVSKDNATAQSISTLQTTVNGQTASIQQHSQSINGLSAQYTVKVQTGGIVSGVGMMSSNGVSAFAVRADQFYIAPPTGTNKGVLPFTVQTTPRTVNGVSVPAGTYIDNAFIANGSIGNAHIANGSITTAKIGNAQIGNAQIANGAITTAKIGNAQIGNAQIANGAITTAKIGTAQVDTLQIAGEAVVVPRAAYDDTPRSNYTGKLLNLSLDNQGAPTVINASIDITSVSLGYRGEDITLSYVTAKLDRTYRVILKANNEVIANRQYRVQNYITDQTDSLRALYAGSYNKQLEISNLLHTPKNNLPQTYTLEIVHESGSGTHTINSVSILAMAVKR